MSTAKKATPPSKQFSGKPPTASPRKYVGKKYTKKESIEIKEKFISVLDNLDRHVADFRTKVLDLSKKRDILLTCTDLLKSEETMGYATCPQKHRIWDYSNKVNLVEIKHSTVRTASQEESLSQVNSAINSLVAIQDAWAAKRHCEILLNSCSEVQNDFSLECGGNIVDRNFELMILGCSLDDQKETKERLKSLMSYIDEKLTRSQTL